MADPPDDAAGSTGSDRATKADAAAPSGTPRNLGMPLSLSGLCTMVGVGLVVGFAGPLGHGWLPTLMGVALASGAVVLRDRAPHDSRWAIARLALSRRRVVIVLLAGLPAAVFCAVGARAVGALLTSFGGAHFALGVVALAAVSLAWAKLGRAALPLGLLAAAVAMIAGVYGTRYEAAAPTARGSMQSGPVHGIHPFQMTALTIDGYGPFDIPINDYVEPNGDKGYTPEQLADVLERAVHAAADVHFPNGPQRARAALLGAEAGFVRTPAVIERIGSDPGVTEHPRFWLRSGSFGRRSRVEFVCPGRRDDPRGAPADNLMNRMCPDKYASEASAGLGVTGRWPGYVEFRGTPRLGLAPWLGWTRSDDRIGAAVVRREHRWVAWAVLGFALLCVALSALRLGRPAQGVARLGGFVAALLVGALVIGTLGAGAELQIPALSDAELALRPAALLPAGVVVLWLLGGFPSVGGPHRGRRFRGATPVAAAAVAAVTVAVAAHVAIAAWVWPIGGEAGRSPSLTSAVINLAELTFSPVGDRLGWTIFEWEGALAGSAVVLLVGTVASVLWRASNLIGWAWATEPSDEPRQWRGGPTQALAALSIVALAAAFVVSRKTLGGFTLVPGAVALTIVLQSGLALVRRRSREKLGSGRALLHAAAHVGWTAVAIFLVLYPLELAARAGQPLHPFVLVCIVGGLIAALGGLVFLFSSRRDPA